MTHDLKIPTLPSLRASLASPSRALPAAGGVREFLAFVLGEESYALPLFSIREILKLPPVTPVPRAPQDVLGIVSVRGRVTTVIDLRRRLRMPEQLLSPRSRVLLVDNGKEILGLLVDRVLQVYRLHDQEVELASVMGGDVSPYVMGIGRPGKQGRGRSMVQQPDASGAPIPGAGVVRAAALAEAKPVMAKPGTTLSVPDAPFLILLDPVELLAR